MFEGKTGEFVLPKSGGKESTEREEERRREKGRERGKERGEGGEKWRYKGRKRRKGIM